MLHHDGLIVTAATRAWSPTHPPYPKPATLPGDTYPHGAACPVMVEWDRAP